MSQETKKVCKTCGKSKILHMDFYMYKGSYRGTCKACQIKRVVKYQRENKTWLNRNADDEKYRAYQREYRLKNKEKYAAYREKYIKAHPTYHRDYYLANKDK